METEENEKSMQPVIHVITKLELYRILKEKNLPVHTFKEGNK
jgi:hypothetical protein